jgi:hypothetical protein
MRIHTVSLKPAHVGSASGIPLKRGPFGGNHGMHRLVSAMLIVAGVIHLLPLSGAIGSERLATLYALQFNEPNLEILMRHRAVLFGLFGGFMIFAAFKPAYQTIAFIGGFISVVSFLYLAWAVGDYNEKVNRVIIADVVALICLVVGGAVHVILQRKF